MGIKLSSVLGGASGQIVKERDDDRKARILEEAAIARDQRALVNSQKLYTFKDNVDAMRKAEDQQILIARSRARLKDLFPVSPKPVEPPKVSQVEGESQPTEPAKEVIDAPFNSENPAITMGPTPNSSSLETGSTSFRFNPSAKPFDPSTFKDQLIAKHTDAVGITDADAVASELLVLKQKHKLANLQQQEKVYLFNEMVEWGVPIARHQFDQFVSEGEDGSLYINEKATQFKSDWNTASQEYDPETLSSLWTGDLEGTRAAGDSLHIERGSWRTPTGTQYEVNDTRIAQDLAESALNMRTDNQGQVFVVASNGDSRVAESGVVHFSKSLAQRANAADASTLSFNDSAAITQSYLGELPNYLTSLKHNNTNDAYVVGEAINPDTGNKEKTYTAIGTELNNVVTKSLMDIKGSLDASAHLGLVNSIAGTMNNKAAKEAFILDSNENLFTHLTQAGEGQMKDLVKYMDSNTRKFIIKRQGEEEAKLRAEPLLGSGYRPFEENGQDAVIPKDVETVVDEVNETPVKVDDPTPNITPTNKLEAAILTANKDITGIIQRLKEDKGYEGTESGLRNLHQWSADRDVDIPVRHVLDLAKRNPDLIKTLQPDLQLLYNDIKKLSRETEEDTELDYTQTDTSVGVNRGEVSTADFTKQFEGMSGTVYSDKGVKDTIDAIGYGFRLNQPHVKKALEEVVGVDKAKAVMKKAAPITQEEADKMFDKVADVVTEDVVRIFPDYDGYPEPVKTVLFDIVYNSGATVFKKSSPKFIAAISENNWMEAVKEMSEGNRRKDNRRAVLAQFAEGAA